MTSDVPSDSRLGHGVDQARPHTDSRREPVEGAPLAAFVAAPPRADGQRWSDTAPSVLRAIRTHLGMDVAFISEFTAGQRVFRVVDAASDDAPVRPGEGGPLDESYCQRVVDGRLPQVIRDAATLPAALELPVTTALPVGAHLSVPIVLRDGRVYGTFCCFSYAADQSLNDRDLAMMRVFADLTAEQIERELERDLHQQAVADRIRAVIAGDGMSVVFQPIVRLAGRRVIGFEALARFHHPPPRGPDVWFAEAAAVGLGVDLELAAIRLAVRALHDIDDDLYISVNLSPETIVSPSLDDALAAVAPTRLVLEITEHSTIAAYDDVAAAVVRLRDRGMRIAVDDAGAGYSSFRHILRLQPDMIKLDRSLTRDIDRDPARRALAAALIAFGHETGSGIVAEGVETAEELRTLQELGVTSAQGYYLGRPGALPAVVPRRS